MNKHFIKKRDIAIFALPGLLFFTIFVIYPIIPQLIISFQDHDGFKSNGFVGFDNYVSILTSKSLRRATMNTYIFVGMSLFGGIPLSLLLALALELQGEKTRRFFKIATVMPALISVTVMAQLWIAIYQPSWGLLNTVLVGVGLENWTHSWLTEKYVVVFSIAFAFLWQYIGLNTLLFYTGIKTIPASFKEAALIDGAGFFKRSWYVTIPLLANVGKYVLVLSTLGCMAQFAHVRVMTSGGPMDLSRTIIYQLYYTAFNQAEYGEGTAIAIVFIIQCVIISLLINKFTSSENVEY